MPSSSSHHHKSSHTSSSSSGRRRTAQTTQTVDDLLESLRTHRVNTLTELCRIERIAASASEEDQIRFQQPMTAAWQYYVTSNQLLSELRSATRNYPFSSQALDDARWRVNNDPASNRSWNYAWLVLDKISNDQIIEQYAASEAAHKDMWGGRTPSPDEARQLADCFTYEWNEALGQFLRHWTSPPSVASY